MGGYIHDGIPGVLLVIILGVCTWYCVHSSLILSGLRDGSLGRRPITTRCVGEFGKFLNFKEMF